MARKRIAILALAALLGAALYWVWTGGDVFLGGSGGSRDPGPEPTGDPRHTGPGTSGSGLPGGEGVRTASRPGGDAQPETASKQGSDQREAAPGRKGRTDGAVLLVKVIDDAGAPVAGVEVLLVGELGERQGTAGGDGVAAFPGLRSGRYEILVHARQGWLGATAEVSLKRSEVTLVTVRCGDQEHSIRGRVLDTDGHPALGAIVACHPVGADGGPLALWRHRVDELEQEVDPAGFYEFSELPAGTFLVVAHWPRTGETIERRAVSPSDAVDLVFQVCSEVVFSGMCTDSTGLPIEGTSISIGGTRRFSTSTLPDGRYQLDYPAARPPEIVLLRARKEGFKDKVEKVAIRGNESGALQVDFVLEELEGESAIEGALVDPERNPVAGETVQLSSIKSRTMLEAITGDDGTFSFPVLGTGDDYVLRIHPRGKYRELLREGVTTRQGETLRMELVLEPLEHGSIEGVLSDAEGRPLADFPLRLRSSGNWSREVRFVTDAEGRFLAENIPAGDLLISSWSPPSHSISGITLEAGGHRTLELELGVGQGAVEGFVRDSGGGAEAGARVVLFWSKRSPEGTSQAQFSAVADASGWYRVSGLPPGEFRLQVRSRSGGTVSDLRTLAGKEEWNFVVGEKGETPQRKEGGAFPGRTGRSRGPR